MELNKYYATVDGGETWVKLDFIHICEMPDSVTLPDDTVIPMSRTTMFISSDEKLGPVNREKYHGIIVRKKTEVDVMQIGLFDSGDSQVDYLLTRSKEGTREEAYSVYASSSTIDVIGIDGVVEWVDREGLKEAYGD